MSLTLDAIHAPLNDFFLDRFKTQSGDAAQFRFDRLGSMFSDADFAIPNLAQQAFSDLVNFMPFDQGDGVTVDLSPTPFDDQYFYQVLSSASPCVPPGADEATASAMMSSFGALKVEGQRRWRDGSLESTRPTHGRYEASYATPADWYDASSASWTHHEQQITEQTGTPAPSASPAHADLWRLNLGDEAVAAILKHPVGAVDPVAPILLQPHATMHTAVPVMAVAPAHGIAGPAHATAAPVTFAHATAAPLTLDHVALHDAMKQRMASASFDDRLLLNRQASNLAPTRPAGANSLSVSFDYCLVTIRRPWLFDAFLQDTSWCIPATAKGALTADRRRALSVVTVAFVAIRNLVIDAHWSDDDYKHALEALTFGTFRVDPGIVDNKLAHAGVQIIGWLIQPLPQLPPNDAPQ